MNTPGPRIGSLDGGSTVANIISGTHFFPQLKHGTSFMLVNGASLYVEGDIVLDKYL